MSRLTTRFDISKLTGRLVDENGKDTPRGAFQDLASNKQPLDVGDAEIESIEVFQYLGSQVDSSGKMTVDIDKRIAQASKALWSTQKSSFPRP